VVKKALAALRSAHNPSPSSAKGRLARAEDQVRRFIEETQMPFLPQPMGRGVVPDDPPPECVSSPHVCLAERRYDLLIGARLNWICIRAANRASARMCGSCSWILPRGNRHYVPPKSAGG